MTFNDDAENAESLTSAATTAVAALPTTVALNNGKPSPTCQPSTTGTSFTFDLTFSENVAAGYARIRDDAFTVDRGRPSTAPPGITQGSNQELDRRPSSQTGNGSRQHHPAGNHRLRRHRRHLHQMTAKSSPTPRPLTVAGPPAISVSDANVREADGAVLAFTATLSRASSRTVTVDYATSDGTAQAGSDYTAASATLTFNAGDTSQTVQVTVLTDSEDEGQETLTLTLSNPSQATLDDAHRHRHHRERRIIFREHRRTHRPKAHPKIRRWCSSPPASQTCRATHNGSEFTFDLDFQRGLQGH